MRRKRGKSVCMRPGSSGFPFPLVGHSAEVARLKSVATPLVPAVCWRRCLPLHTPARVAVGRPSRTRAVCGPGMGSDTPKAIGSVSIGWAPSSSRLTIRQRMLLPRSPLSSIGQQGSCSVPCLSMPGTIAKNVNGGRRGGPVGNVHETGHGQQRRRPRGSIRSRPCVSIWGSRRTEPGRNS